MQHVEGLPQSLKPLPQWVVWRFETREGKQTKVPYRPHPARLIRASSSDPATWGTLEAALEALRAHRLEGLGFVFAKSGGIVGVDLDWKGYQGEGIPPEAQTIVDRLDSYTEWSPSRKGCHVLLLGKLPEGTPHRKQLAPGVELEVYDQGRYFTMSGWHWAGYPTDLEERQAALEALLAELFPPAPAPPTPLSTPHPTVGELSDFEILENLFRLVPKARNLWEGDTSAHENDHSRADWALSKHLMWITGNDQARADRLFRQSKLYRPKWDERHAADGRTYGQLTLSKAWAFNPYTPAGGRLSTSAPEVTPERVWPEPEPLDDLATPAPPPFDALELLPTPLGPWAEDTAARMNAPVEFTTTAALVAAAGVLGNRVLIAPDPEANPGWLEAPNLWGLLVGEPGTKKTPVMEAAFAPLHAIEGKLHRENQRRRTEWELERRNRKKGDPVTEGDLHPPAEEALLTHDITPEKLADLFEHNPYGLTTFQDELLGLIAAWERPEKAGERQFYLKLWNGLSSHTLRRIQRGSHYLPVCTLSLVGGAQPGPLRRYILEAARGWNNDGLLHRFQLTVYGELPPYQRVVRPPNSLKAEYAARLEGLASLARQLPGAPQVELGPELTRSVLTFDPEGQALYLQWLEQTARESRQPSTPTLKRSLLEKQAGLVPKLALLLHLVEGYPQPQSRVGGLAVARAIALANLYKAHTLNLWQEAIRPEVQGAVLLGRRILERVQTKAAFNYRRFSERDILRANWKGLTEPETVRRALGELEARGWIAREGSAWVPNPRLWEGNHA